jgi:streptogramin lyase
MLIRRMFLSLAAASTVSAAPRADLSRVPTRKVGKVETVFDTPGPQPNGLQATDAGLWIMDQGNDHVYLVDAKGKVLRDLHTEADKASGITFDGKDLWLASTYSRELIRCDAKTGKTLERRFTPGAGVIYQQTGDAPGRSSPLLKKRSAAPPAARPAPPSGPPLGPIPAGTGAHGLEWLNGKLWVTVPPSRLVYRIEPKAWVVEHSFYTAGNRPHGIGWEGRFLWVTDSNLNAFFKHDPDSGEIVEKIQLADSDPLPHGMTIRDGVLWYCDDVGVVCRLKL